MRPGRARTRKATPHGGAPPRTCGPKWLARLSIWLPGLSMRRSDLIAAFSNRTRRAHRDPARPHLEDGAARPAKAHWRGLFACLTELLGDPHRPARRRRLDCWPHRSTGKTMQPRLMGPDHSPARQSIPGCWGQNLHLHHHATRTLGPEHRLASRCNPDCWGHTPTCYTMQPGLLGPERRPARRCNPDCWSQHTDLLRDAIRTAEATRPTCYAMQSGLLGSADRPATRCNLG